MTKKENIEINQKKKYIIRNQKKKYIIRNQKKKYIAIFLIKERDTYTELKRKRFNPSQPNLSFIDKLFIIDASFPSWTKGVKNYFFIDINKELNYQIFFSNSKNKEGFDLEILDKFISKSIVKQLTSNLTDTAFKINLMYICFGALIGGLIGFIAGGYV